MNNLFSLYKKQFLVIIFSFSCYAILDISLPLLIGFFPRYSVQIQKYLAQFPFEIFLAFIAPFILFLALRHYLISLFAKIGFSTIYDVYQSASSYTVLSRLRLISKSKLRKGELQKLASADIDFIVAGFIIPGSTFLVELLILLISTALFISALGFDKFSFIVLPFVIVVALILYFQIIRNKKLGKMRDKAVNSKIKIISYIESLSYEIFSYNSFDYALDLFNKSNKEAANVSSNQSQALVNGRVTLESSYGIFLVLLLILNLNNGQFSSNNDELLNDNLFLLFALSMRLIPGIGRLIQSSQSISYVWPTIISLISNLKSSILSDLNPSLDGIYSVNNANSLISFIKASVSVQDHHLFNIDNVSIPKKGIISVFGASGSGKSSFLVTLYDLLSKDHSIPIAYMKQDIPHPLGSVYEYIALSNVYDETLIDELLLSLKLDFLVKYKSSYINPGQESVLSGGQIQRLALARALYHRSQLLLLDEFTSALDDSTQESVMLWLKEYAHRHSICVICSSHRQAIKKYSDLILSINDKQLSLLAS